MLQMLILENKSVDKGVVEKIISTAKSYFDKGEYKFDVNVTNSVNIWCDGDKDKTVFIQVDDDDAYATFNEWELENIGATELTRSLTWQLNTDDENEESDE